ncbi:MAG: butyrate kinase [Bacteroidales bacterium]|jgi:butyrate kinase|nr:butyrate kinase [Bacteroidales bacterium]
MKNRILVINPGSTSTKIAVFENARQVCLVNIKHSSEELSRFATITDQYDFRKNVIVNELKNNNFELNTFVLVIGRGGLIKPVLSGVYAVNDLMKEHLRNGYSGQHASNLGGLIADSIAHDMGLNQAYVADPVVVDELSDVARISGHPDFERVSIFHALNQKAIARMYAGDRNKKYEELNLVVAHLGGGISVGVHKSGRVVDVNQALDGEGPFSPERSGTLPMNQIIDTCFSGKYTRDEIHSMIVGKGGYVAYFGTNNAYDIEQQAIAGDAKANLIEEAMAYQTAKQIGASVATLGMKPDAIILTGGLAKGDPFVARIKKYIHWMADEIAVYKGEDEMQALASNAVMILEGKADVREYR